MMYCINPKCRQRKNPDGVNLCQNCGTTLLIKNRYRLIKPLTELNRPGNAELFQVEDNGAEIVKCEKYKVIKILKRSNATLVRLFQQEAKVLKSIRHPGIPKVNVEDGYFTVNNLQLRKPLHCLVMEKIEGENLETWVKNHGKISQEQAISWLKQILDILVHLHDNKYLHRDIKPSNIILRSLSESNPNPSPTPDNPPLTPPRRGKTDPNPEQEGRDREHGQLVLIDFGSIGEIKVTFLIGLGRKTEEEGTSIVSPSYTAPEQINGKAVPQSDLYALGRTFVHLVTGIHPLDIEENQKNGQLLWRKHAPQISSALADWIDYLMASFPWDRPPNAYFVLEKLNKGLSSPPISKPAPPWLIIMNVALFSVLLITGLLWFQTYQENQLEEYPTVSHISP